MEGKCVSLIMSLVTIFALFGDDIRLWATFKMYDDYFNAGMVISFVIFSIEISINTLVVDDFKFSFFFWLDIIATLSLIPDIEWFIEPLRLLANLSPSYESVDAMPG